MKTELKNAYLDFDRDKMEVILYNLISNAVKFTPEGGKIIIDVKNNKQENSLQIDVSDNGAGISQDQLPHVFDRFYQGSEATRSGETGSGIGLALVKELVELHQGRIKVNSIEHEGTRFSIFLPFGKQKQIVEENIPVKNGDQFFYPVEIPKDPVATIPEEAALSSENTLLLVEDNPDMRAFIRDTLAGTYHIIEAVDGQDGIEKAYQYIPDIIISDVMMPRKDGLQLCEILKNDERTSHIPIILLTAKADIESRLAGLERGADDYLAKPFNRDELLIRSRNLLNLRKRLWERYSTLHHTVPAESKDVEIEDAFLQKIRGIIEEHLSDSELEIEQLSRLVGMSRSQMFRKIKALTGQSPSLYIRAIRLHKAKELLQSTEMNVSEVAYTVGFSTPTYFSDAFLEVYGVRPSQVKK
jgi:DNA-binding response OmpR family regulator